MSFISFSMTLQMDIFLKANSDNRDVLPAVWFENSLDQVVLVNVVLSCTLRFYSDCCCPYSLSPQIA